MMTNKKNVIFYLIILVFLSYCKIGSAYSILPEPSVKNHQKALPTLHYCRDGLAIGRAGSVFLTMPQQTMNNIISSIISSPHVSALQAGWKRLPSKNIYQLTLYKRTYQNVMKRQDYFGQFWESSLSSINSSRNPPNFLVYFPPTHTVLLRLVPFSLSPFIKKVEQVAANKVNFTFAAFLNIQIKKHSNTKSYFSYNIDKQVPQAIFIEPLVCFF